ncbi:MAG: M20/M25/M40 family metallo-hydrolase [bacterium]|nr:M20/M25/M40 family metallo-hydrolase [bacterium]
MRTEPSGPPLYLTAHLDHPAFAVDDVPAFDTVELTFRGGVMADYFKNARVRIHTATGPRLATISGKADVPRTAVFEHWYAKLDETGPVPVRGDVGVWDLPPAEVIDGIVHTLACDDLAALAAALAAFDELLARAAELPRPVRLLCTRAEEIGFVGAIGACRARTVPLNARVIALENSRSFTDSPIGGGPVVRVGDRVSVFSPSLTDAIAMRAEELAGGGASVTAAQKLTDLPAWKWQRKLMSGGACEASVFCHYGYEATCVCLPLGNYHNMGDLTNVQAGTNTRPATIEREFIALSDYEGLVELLIGCGLRLGESGKVSALVTKLWDEKSFVLDR